MCGLTGVICGTKKRSREECERLGDLFTRLLLLSEHRGPYATGVALIKQNGAMQVIKEPLPARQFVQTDGYLNWLTAIDQQVTYLMGHTRWPSYGSVRNPAENHPITLPIHAKAHWVAVTHNGSLKQVAHQFVRLQLPRTTQVDTELLARLAQRHAGQHGIDVEAFLNALIPLDGSMSLALVATTRPEEILLLKGNMPLEVRIHRRKRLLVYASEASILDMAIDEKTGWEALPMTPGDVLVVHAAAIHVPQRYHFAFQGMVRQSAWRRFTGE